MSGQILSSHEVMQRLLNNRVGGVLVLQNRLTQFLPSPTPLLQHHPSLPLPRMLQRPIRGQVLFAVSPNDGHPLLPSMMTTSPPWRQRVTSHPATLGRMILRIQMPPRCVRPYVPKVLLLRQRQRLTPTLPRPADNVSIMQTKRLVSRSLPPNPLMKPRKKTKRKAQPDVLSRKLASTMVKSYPTTPLRITTHPLLDKAPLQTRGIKSPHHLPIMPPSPQVMNWQSTSNQAGWPKSKFAPLSNGLKMLC